MNRSRLTEEQIVKNFNEAVNVCRDYSINDATCRYGMSPVYQRLRMVPTYR